MKNLTALGKINAKIEENVDTNHGYTITEGVCDTECTSFVDFHGLPGLRYYCECMKKYVMGPGHPCIPWHRYFRKIFEEMFKAIGCPTCDYSPIEWTQNMMDMLKQYADKEEKQNV